MHVVVGGAGLAMAALKDSEEDLLGEASGNCRGEAALPGGDAGETADVGTAGPEDSAQGVAKHLVGDAGVGRDRKAVGSVTETREQGYALAVGAALRRVT